MSTQNSIEQKLTATFAPVFLQVENESHQHNVPKNAETHFKVTLASQAFVGLNKVKRHQQVYQLLQSELAGEVHALALHLFTSEEWQSQQNVPDSPNCLGGSKR